MPIPEQPEAALTLTQTSSGLVLELELDVRMVGPCFRCLGDAALPATVRSREYQATSPGESDELRTPYLVDDRLDLSAWARDAVALALPDKILCRPDCAGLCPVCGRDLNLEPHEHEEKEAGPALGGPLRAARQALAVGPAPGARPVPLRPRPGSDPGRGQSGRCCASTAGETPPPSGIRLVER